MKLDGVTVLEREHLDELYGEITRENYDETMKVAKKKFVAANLAIAGSISEFEWCRSGGTQEVDVGGLLGFGDFSVGEQSSSAHVGFQLRLIDVASGKILKSVRAEGRAEEDGLTFNANLGGVKYSRESFGKTPLGKANQIAVAKAVAGLEQAIRAPR